MQLRSKGSDRTGGPDAMKARFLIFRGAQRGLSSEFSSVKTFYFGRATDADFRFDADLDPHISRKHFAIEISPPGIRLIDLGSRNGTYVNGEKVKEKELAHGDEIKIGRTLLCLQILSDSHTSDSHNSWSQSGTAESFA